MPRRAKRPVLWVILCLMAVGGLACGGGGAGKCSPGESVACYDGPAGTKGVGDCRAGQAVCNADGTPGKCEGEILPRADLCDGHDNDCDGAVDEDVTNVCGGCAVLQGTPATRVAPAAA